MGVRGLTTFINNNRSKYMENYKLHDTLIVIDGNNIACQLYKWHCTRNDCFGGDYDKYAKVVFDFFALLRDCNVTPIVVFDGGYENKKMKTVYSRLKKKIRSAKYVNSSSQKDIMIFPILMNSLFTQIVVKLNYQIVRTDFEADYEMACLAQNLKCPVLSYDSDFYIFDVLYLPFSTFHMAKYKLNKTQYYIKCEMYTIDNFIEAYPGLSRTTLPLMATLLGNDYIKKRSFKQFFDEMKIPKAKHLKSGQQQTIITLLKWMQNETFSSAVNKIVNRMKKKHTRRVLKQIKFITRGYICRKSILLSFLNIELEDDAVTELELEVEGEDDDDESSEENDAENAESDNEDVPSDKEDLKSDDEDPNSDDEDSNSDDEDPKSVDEDPKSDDEDPKSDVEGLKSEDEGSKSEDEGLKSDNEGPKCDDEAPKTDDESPKSDDEAPKSDNEDPKSDEEDPKSDNEKQQGKIKEPSINQNHKNCRSKTVTKSTVKKLTIKDLPSWFLQNFRMCKYPSNFMDILTRNKYFCNPQVENYAIDSSYKISVDVLAAINKILTSGNLEKLTYVSRKRRHGLRNYRAGPCQLNLPKLFEIENLNREELKNILLTVLGIDRDKIDILDDIPENWHLYILSILFWIQNSNPKITNSQLYSLCLCMLVLSVVDPQVGFFRSTTKFYNKLDATLKGLSKTKAEKAVLPEGVNFKNLLDGVTYNHCVLGLKELITFFQMEYKMASRSTIFNIQVLHPFAELQTCLLHIQYLNMLLNEPFQNFLISEFYDGTFIYNMTVNLMKRTDVESYLNVLLEQSSSILLCSKYLFDKILKLSSGNITNTKGKKRRKKNNNKGKLTVLSFMDENELKESEDEDETLVDVNNKFSLLNLLK